MTTKGIIQFLSAFIITLIILFIKSKFRRFKKDDILYMLSDKKYPAGDLYNFNFTGFNFFGYWIGVLNTKIKRK